MYKMYPRRPSRILINKGNLLLLVENDWDYNYNTRWNKIITYQQVRRFSVQLKRRLSFHQNVGAERGCLDIKSSVLIGKKGRELRHLAISI